MEEGTVQARETAIERADPQIFDENTYVQARRARLANLFRHIEAQSLTGKRVLELGCGTGEMGEEFVKLGCRVTSIDSREEFITALRERFPTREAYVMDLDHWDPSRLGTFDIILCFGVLYHISRPTALLGWCARIAGEIYLETVVCDSAEATYALVSEDGPDRASSGKGCRPTPSWLVMVMNYYGFEQWDISSPAANWAGDSPSVFDWTPRNDSSWVRDGALLRKMYVFSRRSDRALGPAQDGVKGHCSRQVLEQSTATLNGGLAVPESDPEKLEADPSSDELFRIAAPVSAFVSAEFSSLDPVDLNFNDEWQLAGLRFLEEHGRFTLALRWRCLRRVKSWLRCAVHVEDAEGNRIASMDHDLLHGIPGPAEWRPGDEGYEIQYASVDGACLPKSQVALGSNGYEVREVSPASRPFRARLILLDTNTQLRLPLVASTLPVADHYTAATIEANSRPGSEHLFRFKPVALVPCRVCFETGVTLVGYSFTNREGIARLRVRWRAAGDPKVPLYFFAHAIPSRDPEVAAVVSFDQDMRVEYRCPPSHFEQNIIRALPPRGPGAAYVRAGVYTSANLERLAIVGSSLDWDPAHRCMYIPLESTEPHA